jgi:serine/threonine protein kinase
MQSEPPVSSRQTPSSGSRPSDYWEPPTSEVLAKQLPQYEFLELIGRGGMGAVYRARQLSLDRLVAIKVLPGDVLDETDAAFVQRFKNEARTMGKMNHPGIVNVYDFGEAMMDGGRERLLYFVMEYVEGTDVAQMVVSQGRLQPDHALAIIAHVCDALAYAHANGVIHRDIKPANVLISRSGHVKVADFGLAKGGEDARLGLTRSNVALGTPDYVAPEALMIGMEADHRCDLYAVGVMLFNLLTGEIPRGMFQLPSAKVGTDPRFDQIITKAMQADRERRYQSAAEIRRDMDQILTTPMAKVAEGEAAVPVVVESGGRPVTKHSAPVKVHGPPSRKNAASVPVGGRGQSSPVSTPAQPTPAGSSSRSLWLPAVLAVPVLILGGWWMMSSPSKEPPPEAGAGVSATIQTKSKDGSAVASSGSVSAGSAVAGQLYPPGKWVKVFHTEESVKQWTPGTDAPMRRDADGWLRFGTKTLSLKPKDAVGKNWGIRARFKHMKDRWSKLVLRNGTQAKQYNLYLTYGDARLKVHFLGDVTSPAQSSPPVSLDFLKEGEEYEAEFFVIGNRLVGRVADRYLGKAVDDKISSGEVEIWGLINVRDIEVVNLDGLEEEAALRIARVDRSGADTNPKAMLASLIGGAPSSNLTIEGSNLPQGQWVRLLQRAEQLSPQMRQDGVSISPDGWISAKSGLNLEGIKGRNMGIRAKFRRIPVRLKPTMRLRIDRVPQGGWYEFSHSQRRKVRMFQGAGGSSVVDIEGEKAWEEASEVPEGAVYLLEFYAIGSRLVGLVNGKLVSVATNDRWKEGWAAVFPYENPMRELEVINLDGLSEDEALSRVGLKNKLEHPALAANSNANSNSNSTTTPSAGEAAPAQASKAEPTLPAEGVEIRQRMDKLSVERVREPYEASLKKLNSGYLSALQREEEKARKAGKLDEVLKFQQEMGRFKSNDLLTLAGEDDDGTPDALKQLRGTWRSAHAAMVKARDETEQALFGQYVSALQNLESELTRQNRVKDALAVREFRVNGLQNPDAAAVVAANGQTATTATPSGMTAMSDPAPAAEGSQPQGQTSAGGDPRAAAMMVFSKGGTVEIQVGKEIRTARESDLISKDFEIVSILIKNDGRGRTPISNAEMQTLAGLRKLKDIRIEYADIEDEGLRPLQSLPELRELTLRDSYKTTDAGMAILGTLKGLRRLVLEGSRSITNEGVKELTSLKDLEGLFLAHSSLLDDGVVPYLRQIKGLRSISLHGCPRFTSKALAEAASLPNLLQITFSSKQLDEVLDLGAAKLTACLFYGESNQNLMTETELSSLTTAKTVRFFQLTNRMINEAQLERLAKMDNLNTLLLEKMVLPGSGLAAMKSSKVQRITLREVALTDEMLKGMAEIKTLKRIEYYPGTKLTDEGLAAFAKLRSYVVVQKRN